MNRAYICFDRLGLDHPRHVATDGAEQRRGRRAQARELLRKGCACPGKNPHGLRRLRSPFIRIKQTGPAVVGNSERAGGRES
jgi:hypothetical protein